MQIRWKLLKFNHSTKFLSLVVPDWQEKADENKKVNDKLYAWLDEAILYHKLESNNITL